MRLDKWLWAARFFKTRQLAAEAIKGGKVHLNGQRAKPGKDIRSGSLLRIHKASLEWEVEVKVLPKQRRPAAEAVHFYEESEESILRRQQITTELRDQRAATGTSPGSKPSKRNRRMIHRFINKSDLY
ncbi:Ribosome-associated heat shock protein implicated in the recycling of the 50S subunit (S4 paralog) [hydrothermal vent metagenome]|uniref:Ribosome-associated heat shock protein implicated in the recycling of the 50S subunit (S4 paralog) n=1 Tax=hydrothermal vent metagenome TaxID=652676 RepID=A0A3B1ASJ8_9ZZZZ